MIDLWPDDIEHTTLKAPVTILKEQGELLGRKTDNIVEGEVVSNVASTYTRVRESFEFTFYLYGPALGYHYRLLTISHSDDIYPLVIRIDETVLGELPAEMTEDAEVSSLIADSEDRFMEILKAIFATKKVRKVIEAIMAQSGVATEAE